MEIKTIDTLQELPPLGETKCSLTPEEIADKGIERFNKLSKPKFMKGQAEHGGCLVDNVTLDHMEEEIIDLWFYVAALRLRLGK